MDGLTSIGMFNNLDRLSVFSAKFPDSHLLKQNKVVNARNGMGKVITYLETALGESGALKIPNGADLPR